jgi:hypothetical protein
MRWAALALGVVTVACLVWIGGEVHYRNCLNHAKSVNVLEPRALRASASPWWGKLKSAATVTKQEAAASRERRTTRMQARLNGCSRVPF